MFENQMNLGLIPPLISVYLGVCLSLLSFTRSRRRKENVLFTALCVLVSLRPSQYLLQGWMSDPPVLLFVERVIQFLYWYLPAVGIFFFSSLLGVRKPHVEWGSLLVACVMGFYALHPSYVTGLYVYEWGVMGRMGPGFFVFLFYCLLSMAYIIHVVMTALASDRDAMARLKQRYILSALAIGSVLLMLSVLPLMGVDLYPAANFMFLPLGILAYGVLRYRILDMGTLMRLAMFRLVYGSVILVPNILIFMLLKPVVLTQSLYYSVPLLLAWYAMNHFYSSQIHPIISRRINRYQYRLKSAEGKFARDLLILRDTRSLVTEFGELIRSTLCFDTTHFFFALEEGSRLKDMDGHDVTLSSETINWLVGSDRLLDRYLLQVDWVVHSRAIREELQELFDAWDGLCSVPLVQHGELIGLVILADKRGGGSIAPLEICFLEKVSRYLSIALYNSRVYQAVTSLKDQLEFRRRELSKEILERGRAKESVRQSEERYRILAENILDTLIVVDVKSETIRYISPSCHKVSGYTAPDLEGESVWSLFKPEAQRGIAQIIPARSGKRSFLVEVELLRKDGSTIWLEVSCHYVADAETPAGELVGLARDISERRDAEMEKDELHKRLRQAQKMESIGVLAGGIAHDFNNILMGILGYTQLAGLYLEGETGRAPEIISQIETAGMRAKELVSQILAFSRQSEQVRCAVDMVAVTREALGLLKATIPKGVHVTSTFPREAAMVVADPVQIHQIVLNLCTNATHALDEMGGTISVRVRRTEMDSGEARRLGVEPGSYVELRVADTGRGMDDDTRQRIFDPYFTTKGAGKGTGMGLAVVQGIILSHNGTVVVDSEKDLGSRFHVYLPETAAIQPLPGLSIGGEAEACGRILFVDDESMLVELAQEALSRMGFEVTAMEDPVAALALFREAPDHFDVVVTDMTMPKMSGIRLADQLRAIQPSLPVILCTGFSNDLVGKDHSELGVSNVLFKPVPMKDLADAIRAVHGPGSDAI